MIWFIVLGCIYGALFAWFTGANDAANALATTVGCKALSIRKAAALGAVCEFVGVISLGWLISGAVAYQIVDVGEFQALEQRLFVLGHLSVLCCAAIWLVIATWLSLPVSTTHTIVSGVVACTVRTKGWSAVNTSKVIGIGASWVASPLVSLLVSYLLYMPLKKLVLRSKRPLHYTQLLFPSFTGVTVSLFVVFLLLGQRGRISWSPDWFLALLFFLLWALIDLITRFILLPRWQAFRVVERLRAPAMDSEWNHSMVKLKPKPHISLAQVTIVVEPLQITVVPEEKQAMSLYSALTVLSSVFVAFAHGAQSIGNCVGPFGVIYQWTTASAASAAASAAVKLDEDYPLPFWLFICAGLLLSLGMLSFGARVIATVGEKIAILSFASAYVAQISTAIVVTAATIARLPISTSHAIVGSVIGVSLVYSETRASIAWYVVARIGIIWFLTIVVGAGGSLSIFELLKLAMYYVT